VSICAYLWPISGWAAGSLSLAIMKIIRAALVFFALCLVTSCAQHSQPAQSANATPTPLTAAVLSPAEAKTAFDSADGLTKALERRWPLTAIRTYCIPERRHNPAYQNLVAYSPVWKGILFSRESTGFDKIAWYACLKKGRVDQYSLGVYRGKDFWLLEIGDQHTLEAPPDYSPDPTAERFLGRK
jgi:hypothetical protein